MLRNVAIFKISCNNNFSNTQSTNNIISTENKNQVIMLSRNVIITVPVFVLILLANLIDAQNGETVSYCQDVSIHETITHIFALASCSTVQLKALKQVGSLVIPI